MKTAREIIADIVDRVRGTSDEKADAILAALAAEGFSIVETGRDPVWSLETDDDALICRSGTMSITVRAGTATLFDAASGRPAKVVPVRSLSRSTREGKTE